jgi:hypothetical protein
MVSPIDCPCVAAERGVGGCADCWHFGGARCVHCGNYVRHAGGRTYRNNLRPRLVRAKPAAAVRVARLRAALARLLPHAGGGGEAEVSRESALAFARKVLAETGPAARQTTPW